MPASSCAEQFHRLGVMRHALVVVAGIAVFEAHLFLLTRGVVRAGLRARWTPACRPRRRRPGCPGCRATGEVDTDVLASAAVEMTERTRANDVCVTKRMTSSGDSRFTAKRRAQEVGTCDPIWKGPRDACGMNAITAFSEPRDNPQNTGYCAMRVGPACVVCAHGMIKRAQGWVRSFFSSVPAPAHRSTSSPRRDARRRARATNCARSFPSRCRS